MAFLRPCPFGLGCASMRPEGSIFRVRRPLLGCISDGRRKNTWVLPWYQQNAWKVLFVQGDTNNVWRHQQSIVEGRKTGTRQVVNTQTFALSIAFRLIPNWSSSSFLFCRLRFLSTVTFLFTWASVEWGFLIIVQSLNSLRVRLHLTCSSSSLMSSSSSIGSSSWLIFTLPVEALTRLHRLIEQRRRETQI